MQIKARPFFNQGGSQADQGETLSNQGGPPADKVRPFPTRMSSANQGEALSNRGGPQNSWHRH